MFIKTLKTYIKQRLFIIFFLIFSLSLLCYFNQRVNKKTVIQIKKVSPGLPVRLIIPVINVNAGIQYVGVTSDGKMEVPSNEINVGWFNLGPRPGEKGSAVIDGHFNRENGEAGVFANLYKLKKGDKLYIKDDKGILITFTVMEKRIYDIAGDTGDIFNPNDNAHLNLITCDGIWDGVKKNYTKRLVIFAE